MAEELAATVSSATTVENPYLCRAFKPLSLSSSAAPTSSTLSPDQRRQSRSGRMSSISYSSRARSDPVVDRGKENREPSLSRSQPPPVHEQQARAKPLTLVEKHADLLSSIAQKEAKVYEARQELQRHEAELADLKRRWEQAVTRTAQRSQSSSISSLPSNPSSSSIASASTAHTSVESSSASPDISAVAQFSALVQNALVPDQPLISPAAVDTGKRLLGQLMRSVGGGEIEGRASLDVVKEESEASSRSLRPKTKRLSLTHGAALGARHMLTSPAGSEDREASENPGRTSDDGWTKRWDEVVSSDGFQSSKRATINFGSTLSDSIRSVLPVELFPLPNLSPTPSHQLTQAPSTPTSRPKPIKLRNISSSLSVMDEDSASDGLGLGSLPKPITPARPRPMVQSRIKEEEQVGTWEW